MPVGDEKNQDEKVTRWSDRGGRREEEERKNDAYCPGPRRGR